MSTQKHNSRIITEVHDLLKEVKEKSFDGNYIYRGEPEYYETVSSNLYRQYFTEIKDENFDIKVVQDEIVKEAIRYTNLKDKFEIMAELQHFGGKTNLIDFTKDYLIALFFACYRFPKENGKIILKENNNTDDYDIYEPHNPQNRIIAQKSIFIHPHEGYLDLQDNEFIVFHFLLKENLLNYLNKYHDISIATIYNDLHGFIENTELHQSAYTEFHRGSTIREKSKFIEDRREKRDHLKLAMSYYEKAIQHNPQHPSSYNNRGNIKMELDKHKDAIKDFTIAIKIDSQFSTAYFNRGSAKSHLDLFDQAIPDFDKAIEFNSEYSDAYTARGFANYHLDKTNQTIIGDLHKGVELDQKNAIAYYNRGLIKAGLQDSSAEKDLRRAIILAKAQGKLEIVDKAQRLLDKLEKRRILSSQGTSHPPKTAAKSPDSTTANPPPPKMPKAHTETVTDVHHWSDKLFTIKTTRDPAFRFRSGEFAMIGMEIDGKPLMRAYSMASSHYEDYLEFYSIKVEGGAFTSRFKDIAVGDTLLVSKKPTGSLLWDHLRPGKRLYLFSTGTGLAPFLSIIKDPEVYENFEKVILVHGCRYINELTYEKLITSELKDNEYFGDSVRDKLIYYPAVTREPFRNFGRITELIESGKLLGDNDLPAFDVEEDRFMLCGSPAMLKSLAEILEAKGFRETRKSDFREYVIERAFVEKDG